MADTYEIPVISDGHHVVVMFEAVNLLTSKTAGNDASAQFGSIISSVGILGLAVVMVTIIMRGNMQSIGQWFLGYVLVWGVLFVPRVDIVVIDASDPTVQLNPVSNVPIGLAFTAWITSQAGDRVTRTFNTVLSPVDANSTTGTGLLWGQKLVSNFDKFKFSDARVRANVQAYMSRCYFPVASTDPRNIEAAIKSENLLVHITLNPNGARMMTYTPAAGSPVFENCSAVAPKLKAEVASQTTIEMARLDRAFYAPPGDGTGAVPFTPPAQAASDISAVAAQYLGIASTGEALLQQMLMINEFNDVPSNFAQSPEAAAMIALATTRGQAQSKVTSASMGEQMQTMMPKMYVLMFVLLIALFPFILAIGLIPGIGLNIVKNYIFSFVYVQVLPVLFIIINRFIVVEHIRQGRAITAANQNAAGDSVINVSNLGLIAELPTDLSFVAGIMLTILPAIGAGIFTKGISSVAGNMEQILRPVHTATEAGAAEATTGNISRDNVNVGNHNIANSSMGQVRNSPDINAGHMSQTTGSGGTNNSFSDGSSSFQLGKSQSQMLTSGNVQQRTVDAIQNQRSQSLQDVQASQQMASEMTTKADAQSVGLASSLASSSEASAGQNANVSKDLRSSAQSLQSAVKSYAMTNGLDLSQQESAMAQISAGGEVKAGFSMVGNGATLNASGSLGGSSNSVSNARFTEEEAQRWNQMIDSSEVKSAVSGFQDQVSQSDRFAASNTKAQSLNSSLSEVESYQEQESTAQREVESLNSMLSQVQESGSSFATQTTDTARNLLAERYSPQEALEAMEVTDPTANPVAYARQVHAFDDAAQMVSAQMGSPVSLNDSSFDPVSFRENRSQVSQPDLAAIYTSTTGGIQSTLDTAYISANNPVVQKANETIAGATSAYDASLVDSATPVFEGRGNDSRLDNPSENTAVQKHDADRLGAIGAVKDLGDKVGAVASMVGRGVEAHSDSVSGRNPLPDRSDNNSNMNNLAPTF
jgi:conjugal transfer mating pair stabilization protein TraG